MEWEHVYKAYTYVDGKPDINTHKHRLCQDTIIRYTSLSFSVNREKERAAVTSFLMRMVYRDRGAPSNFFLPDPL